ncbi:MAG: hypothetical protein HYV05_02625 [Deltaproteobacteria bacterium]|nr:hypothetical protein [Deltaproteobacteria bacterium]MBI2347530.1 hypothetical protein [Deltaproteobacteria bacterium]
MSRKQIVCLLLILGAPLAACSAKYVGKNYDGPDLPENEVGIVIFKKSGTSVLGGVLAYKRQAVVSCKVDGERIDMDPEKRSVNLLPGKHTVLFMYDGKRPLVAVEWTFNIEAGHKYLITFPEEQPDSGIMMWLEDLTTGKRVTDITSSPLKSPYACF